MFLKRIALLFILTLISVNVWSQGWRKGEMEVQVSISGTRDIQTLYGLGLDFEPMAADGSRVRMYLVPGELKVLQQSLLTYRVTIPDLEKHFRHFWDNPLVPSGYYTYEEIIAIADSLVTNFPAICKKVSWGTSLGGRQLATLKISDNPDVDEPEPEIMFDGGIHGDEVGGSQNIIMFARDLCKGYGSDPTITNLVNDREIWLFLMVNPDGRVSMSRYNNNGVDCNRDNGYMWNNEGNSSGAFSQVETKALRNCILENQFVVYTNYHSGTEILSYPWSYRAAPPRDLAHINQLAGVYAAASGYSSLLYGQGYNIMYAINGSTKDFQYGSLGNIGWSMEISNLKQPPASQVSFYYDINKPSMIQLISQCGMGISGMVTDSVTGLPVQASIWVGNYFPVYNDPVVGDYHKYILPGTYTVKVMANGYESKTISNVTVPALGTVVADLQLTPSTGYFAHKVMSCRIPGNNFGDEGYTPGALGKPDAVPYALGKNGWIVLDLGDTLFNGSGMDFTVIQSGITDKSFTVSGGHSMDGPFTLIGTGSGTTGFDLNTAGISSIRYLYVKDNGTGPASGAGAGFNLDAVELLSIPVTADFASSAVSPCQGQAVDFTDLSTGNPDNWTWSFPGGTPATSAEQHPAGIRYDIPGQYDVSLTVTNGFSAGSKTRTGYITVQPLPGVSLGNDTAVCSWNIVTLDAGNPGSTYLWSTGATTQTILADSTGVGYGTEAFWVNVTSPAGCQAADTIAIDFENCTGSPEATNQASVKISPNPASDAITIEGSRPYHIAIYTPDGRAVISLQMIRPKETLSLRGLAPGIYLVRFLYNQQTFTRKLIINH